MVRSRPYEHVALAPDCIASVACTEYSYRTLVEMGMACYHAFSHVLLDSLASLHKEWQSHVLCLLNITSLHLLCIDSTHLELAVFYRCFVRFACPVWRSTRRNDPVRAQPVQVQIV